MTIDMTRHSGATGLAVAEQIDRRDVWRVRTDIQPYYYYESEDGREQTASTEPLGVTFIETEFPYKPTMAEVRAFVHGVIDEQTREQIISGFRWQEKPVWLSIENQLNFATAKVGEAHKIGEQEDGTPVYRIFETTDERDAFWQDCLDWKQQCLTAGRRAKDLFDFTPYAKALGITTEE